MISRLAVVAALVAVSASSVRAQSSDEGFVAQVREGSAGVAAAAGAARAKKADPRNAEAAKAPADISGAYRHKIRGNGRVLVDDKLEIAASGDGAVTFSVERQSYEGGRARCELSGIAKFEDGRYVFKDANAPIMSGKPCTLEIRTGAAGIELDDHGTCQDYCGVAMTLSGAKFPASDR
jgi:hypothetical protein